MRQQHLQHHRLVDVRHPHPLIEEATKARVGIGHAAIVDAAD